MRFWLIILFCKKCSLAGASFIFTTSLQPQVWCSAATCSWWLPYWTEMLLNLSGNAFTHTRATQGLDEKNTLWCSVVQPWVMWGDGNCKGTHLQLNGINNAGFNTACSLCL